VKISNSNPRAIPTRVMPLHSAVRIASAVGAEIATMMLAPMAAVFLHHLDGDPAGQNDGA